MSNLNSRFKEKCLNELYEFYREDKGLVEDIGNAFQSHGLGAVSKVLQESRPGLFSEEITDEERDALAAFQHSKRICEQFAQTLECPKP